LVISNSESGSLTVLKDPDPKLHSLEIHSHLEDRLYNLDSGVLFYVPIWLNVAKHEYPSLGLKSGVWWYDCVCGKYSEYVKKRVVKSKSVKSKRKRHWAFKEAHREASTPIVAVRDSDFSSPYWWVGIFDFEVENIDIKRDSYTRRYSPKIPIWLFLSIEVLKRIVGYAISYLNDVHDKKILLINEIENKLLVLYYLVRFSEKYLKKIKHDIFERGRYLKKLNNLGYKSTFFTLTIRVDNYHSLQQILDILIKMFHKFITHLGYYVDWVDYIRFFEIGKKRNTIHIHVLLINKSGFINSDIVRTAWSVNGELIGGVHIKYFDNVNGGIGYTLKYITKLIKYDYDGDGSKLMFEKGFILLSLLWATNKRLYSVSAKFTKEIRRQFILELVGASAKSFDGVRWFGFVVDSSSLLYYSGKFSHLDPPRVVSGGWVYVGSFGSDVFSLPCGIYDLDVVKEYLYPLFSV
jgi:hypothetical protein